MLIRIFDILASIMIVLSLWNVIHSKKWWLVYTVGTLLFIIVAVNKGLVGMTMMGIVTAIMGIKNYIFAGKKKEKVLSTWQAQIFCGLRKGYGPGILSIEKVYRTCQEYADKIGWCVSVTPTKFVYKEGHEPGVVVGVIQYPRFPLDEQELVRRTKELARRLLVNLDQIRVSIAFPNETIMLEAEDEK